MGPLEVDPSASQAFQIIATPTDILTAISSEMTLLLPRHKPNEAAPKFLLNRNCEIARTDSHCFLKLLNFEVVYYTN